MPDSQRDPLPVNAVSISIRIGLGHSRQFWNKGGLITLLNNKGLKVDGVSYTAQQAQKEKGGRLCFSAPFDQQHHRAKPQADVPEQICAASPRLAWLMGWLHSSAQIPY